MRLTQENISAVLETHWNAAHIMVAERPDRAPLAWSRIETLLEGMKRMIIECGEGAERDIIPDLYLLDGIVWIHQGREPLDSIRERLKEADREN